MVYADFEFYTNEYFGRSITEEDFPRLALRSSQYIDYITQGKAERNSELYALKMCCCALAEQYKSIEAAETLAVSSLNANKDGAEVQSESVGSWSKSYRSVGDSALSAAKAAEASKQGLYMTVQQYLSHTGLLYRGGRCCR